MNRHCLLEVAIDSVESARAAQEGGAHRLELCSALEIGGLTPSLGMMRSVRAAVTIPVHAMIRPRGGDFHYSAGEIDLMKRDIEAARDAEMAGIVLGVLNELREVDRRAVHTLIEFARPMSVTFHRAFDVTAEPFSALEEIILAGADRLLTSGQEQSAEEGIELIALLSRKSDMRLVVMAGAGINQKNIRKIVDEGCLTEIHVSSAVIVPPSQEGRGGEHGFGAKRVVDARRVRRLVELLNVQ
jgi:copper homeostasis protein